MPRQARLDAPGLVHHIIIRGIERRKIFRDDQDKDNFIDRLATLVPETQTACYAWALMPNHAHFLMRSGITGISNLMQRLLTGYAVYFNRRHRRHGQLFQNRYKSIICQEDIYFKELVRYIHLNPLRAKLVEDIQRLNKYPYSGHSVLMGKKKNIWYERKHVLAYFGKNLSEAKTAYISYIKKAVAQGRRPQLVGGGLVRSLGGWTEVKRLRLKGQDRLKGDERILGDSEFVDRVLSEANEQMDRHYKLKRMGYDLSKIGKRISQLLGVDENVIYSRARRKKQVRARDLFCYWAVYELGMSRTEVARRLSLSQPAVGYAVNRGERFAKKHKYQLDD